jgi:hypothetical protein
VGKVAIYFTATAKAYRAVVAWWSDRIVPLLGAASLAPWGMGHDCHADRLGSAGILASSLMACNSGVAFSIPPGTSTITVIADADPYSTGSTTATQPCGISKTPGLPSPALAPCSQQTYQISLTVQIKLPSCASSTTPIAYPVALSQVTA